MKVLLTGGGTGGHVNPAIAIANCIKKNRPDAEIAFVGTSRGIENKLVPAEGYPLYHVEIRGLRRSLSLENLRTAAMIPRALHDARRLISEFQPDLAIGTGGYVCWPIIRAAASAHIPTALHESNAVPGVAVKMLEGRVDRIFCNFEETLQYLHHPEKAMRVGNPLKGGFTEIDREQARAELGISGKYRYFILSCGGSLGAQRINEEVLALMRDYSAHHPEVLHIHATGSIEWEDAQKMYRDYGLTDCENLQLVEYIYDMPRKMAAADLVINRAGAMTLSELAMMGKACILIPSPNVTNDHQYKNAHELEKKGAAQVFRESELKTGALTEAVADLISDRPRRESMQKAIRAFAVPDSAQLLYTELMKLIRH